MIAHIKLGGEVVAIVCYTIDYSRSNVEHMNRTIFEDGEDIPKTVNQP